VCFHS